MGQTAVDMAALLPIIGAFKYMDEFKALEKVSKAESVQMLDELTLMANRMSQMGHNFDDITEMGQIALRTRKIDFVIPYENGSIDLWKLYMDGILKFE